MSALRKIFLLQFLCHMLAVAVAFAHDGVDHNVVLPLQMFPAEDMEFYDAKVFDQRGVQKRFVSEELAGRPFVITFFFSRCETFCPAYHALFQALQDELTKRKRQDVQLISVSVDPRHDGLKELQNLAEGLGTGPQWQLVSGEVGEMQRLLRSLGVPRKSPEDHPPMFLVGVAGSGRMQRLVQMPTVADVLRLLEGERTPLESHPAAGEKPE